ncbi:MAG: Zn-dependent oligopeptidase, partial [Bdellovibrionales bacterium]|nr:Zn-dependent oligopeptidase [Bdellovibrionales bacterium]
IEKLESTSDGHYKVTLSYPHYFPFMDDAIDAKARKKLYEKYSQRAGPENVKRLEKAIVIRAKIAKLLGYKNHASYVLEERMAKTPEKVKTFLDELKARLEPLRVAELKTMSEYKKKDSPSDPTIYEWDWRFYNNQILKKEFQVNPDLVRAYFPLEHVTKEMFEIYQTLLGVEFREVKKPMVWHKDVKMYEVRNRGSKKPRAYFYMDLFPRDGKYTHAGAFPLRQGRYDFKEESYIEPIAAIVANFSAPAKNRPSLLSHDELATYFHEFGHIMHQVLTESKYGWFSGTNTERDFVEAPSQMLENWIWNPQMLKKISSHFETRKPLPDEVIMKLIEARNLNVALKNCRQLMFGLFDLTIHTTVKKVNTTSLWQKIKKEVMGIPSGTGSIRQAAFGHIMGGYDAAYYGYLWSEVFAADMFAQFESQGLLNGKIGQKYRETILAPGGSQDAEVMLSTFLGREPSTASFFKQLGLTVSNKN